MNVIKSSVVWVFSIFAERNGKASISRVLLFMVEPGQYFWTVTVSNFWSESETSNVVNAPPVAVSPKLKLSR